jgi:hypothetical protein
MLAINGGTLASNNFDINLAGNWSNTGTFTAGADTVTLDGANQSISGSTVFNNLTKTVSAPATLMFQAGQVQTVQGALILSGAGGHLLSLRSSVSGLQWKIDPQGLRTLASVDVKDGDNINSLVVDCLSNCVDSGDNTGFFGLQVPLPAPVVTYTVDSSVEAWAANLLGSPQSEFFMDDNLSNMDWAEGIFYSSEQEGDSFIARHKKKYVSYKVRKARPRQEFNTLELPQPFSTSIGQSIPPTIQALLESMVSPVTQ